MSRSIAGFGVKRKGIAVADTFAASASSVENGRWVTISLEQLQLLCSDCLLCLKTKNIIKEEGVILEDKVRKKKTKKKSSILRTHPANTKFAEVDGVHVTATEMCELSNA